MTDHQHFFGERLFEDGCGCRHGQSIGQTGVFSIGESPPMSAQSKHLRPFAAGFDIDMRRALNEN
jgi:hypothetical protein